MKFNLVESLLFEDEEEKQQQPEVYFYIDTNTGKVYIFDGNQLTEVNTQKGKPGEPGGGGFPGWIDQDLEDYDDTEFAGILSDEDFINGITDDLVDIQRQERQKHDTELARKLNPNGDMVSAVKKNIKDFISNELQELEDEQERYWADKNSFDDDNARKLPHEIEIEEEDKPLIYIYIDESGSCQGQTARNLLDQCASAFNEFVDEKHPENSKINVEWWYFGSVVSKDPAKTGGGTSWQPLKDHIMGRGPASDGSRPDNVIILTDSDLQGQHGGEHIKIPGSLWCIFVNRKDKDMHIDFDARNYREYLFTGC